MRAGILGKAVEGGKAERLSEGVGYLRFTHDFSGMPRGTVIINGRVIWSYPHIPRIFTLEKGVRRNIKHEQVYVEEKIDGFNLRIAHVKGAVRAFSRGGFLDAFATEKVQGMGLDGFFRENPKLILCCEMTGNTPYTKPAGAFDVRLFVFDIMKEDGGMLPCRERHAIVKRHGLPSVPLLGRFESGDSEALGRLALALDKSKKEGMVIKAADGSGAVKYVTPSADIEDIANGSFAFFDIPAGFFHQRVLRSGMFVRDFGLDRKAYAAKLGEAFYSGLQRALSEAEGGGDVSEEFEILIKDISVWDRIRKHMGREVRIEELLRRGEQGGTRIRFAKVYKRTGSTLRGFLNGKGQID